MKFNMYHIYNRFRNKLYHFKPLLRVYSIFRSDIPDRVAAQKLKKYGYADLDAFFCALDGYSIKCFCEFGTLLGFIREHGFIAHDNDIDLGIIEDDTFEWHLLENRLSSIGLKLTHYYTYNGKVTEQTYVFPDGLSVDIFLYENISVTEMRTFVYYRDHDAIYNNNIERSVKALVYPRISGIKWYEINGYKFRIPKDPESRLEAIYGKTWKVPDPNYIPDRKINIMPGFGEKHGV